MSGYLKFSGDFETFRVISDPAWIIFGLPDAFELNFDSLQIVTSARTSHGPHSFGDEVKIFLKMLFPGCRLDFLGKNQTQLPSLFKSGSRLIP